MPALGGRDRATLFVTTAAYPVEKAEDDSEAGALFALEAPCPGLPTPYMHPIEEPAR